MAASEVPWLGQRIRDERVRRGLSVRGLARDVGVSASMISQIETAKSQPSVSTLYAITSALNISVEDLFTPQEAVVGAATPVASPATVSVGSAGAPPTTVLGALGSYRGGRLGPLVHPAERKVLVLDTGVTWELLGEMPHHAVDFMRVTYPPGGTSSSNGGLMRHPGSEYGHLLSGELILTLGFEELTLRAGDSVSFESSTPHRYRNEGEEAAIGIFFVSEHDR